MDFMESNSAHVLCSKLCCLWDKSDDAMCEGGCWVVVVTNGNEGEQFKDDEAGKGSKEGTASRAAT